MLGWWEKAFSNVHNLGMQGTGMPSQQNRHGWWYTRYIIRSRSIFLLLETVHIQFSATQRMGSAMEYYTLKHKVGHYAQNII